MDTFIHDFAKAFDKVNHIFFFYRLIKQCMKDHLGRWIYNFLNRNLKVAANRTLFEVESVLSGVPQGPVLVSTVFIVLLDDTDEDQRNYSTMLCKRHQGKKNDMSGG